MNVNLRDGLEYSRSQAERILARVATDGLKFTTPTSSFNWYKRQTNPLLDPMYRMDKGARVFSSYQLAAMILVAHCKRTGTFKQLEREVNFGGNGFPYQHAKALAESYGVAFADTVRIKKYA